MTMFSPMVCNNCSKPLEYTFHAGRQNEYCSDLCRNKAKYSRHPFAWITYQHINNTGKIIYIGKTRAISFRTSAHKTKSKWYSEIATTMVQPWKNEAAASVAEAWLIAVHRPVYNVTGLDTSNRRKAVSVV